MVKLFIVVLEMLASLIAILLVAIGLYYFPEINAYLKSKSGDKPNKTSLVQQNEKQDATSTPLTNDKLEQFTEETNTNTPTTSFVVMHLIIID